MIDLTILNQPVEEPEAPETLADSSKINELPRTIGPVTYRGFPVKYEYRRAFSHLQLLDLLAGQGFNEGECYVFLSRGDVDLMSYIQVLVANQKLLYRMGLSTWNANLHDVAALVQMHAEGAIRELAIFLGAINRVGAEARQNIDEYKRLAAGFPDVRIAVAKTHIKAFWGIGPEFAFVCTGSANLNTNVNMEAMTLVISREAFGFFEAFFNELEESL